MNNNKRIINLVPARLVGTVSRVNGRDNTALVTPDSPTLASRTATFTGSPPERGEKVQLTAYGDGWKIIGRNLK